MIPTLRPYQVDAVTGIRQSFSRGHKATCLVLPTGSGKTVIFAYIAATSAARGKRNLILVHRKELLKQTRQKLIEFGIIPGIIHGEYAPNYSASVQIGMVQSMAGRRGRYPDFDLVITDECHHIAARTYLETISAYPSAYQLGVTATPIRTDGKGIGVDSGGVYTDMYVGVQTAELVQMGFLVEPIVHIPPTLVDMSGVRKLGGEYNAKEASERVDKKSITGDAMEHYLSNARYEPAVIFCASVAHAQHVAAEWRAAGIAAYAVDGGQRGKDKDRSGADYIDRTLRGLADGTVHAVMSCDLISEGTDIPAISYMGDLAPTASLGKHLQKIGRALRPAKGKDRALIMDHVGNVGRMEAGFYKPNHGLPTDVREWTLHGEAKSTTQRDKDAAPSCSLCPNCYGVYVARVRICPYCQFERPLHVREIETQEGELVQITPEMILKAKRDEKIEVARAQSLDDLEKIAKARGYKDGWAKHIFNSREAKAQTLTKS